MTNFTFTCSAVADLTAVIVWRYNGEKNPPDADITTNRTHSVLIIRSLTRSNSGNYNCSASNRYGRDSTAVNLIVQGTCCVYTYTRLKKSQDIMVSQFYKIICVNPHHFTAPPIINNFPSEGRDVVLGDSLVITCMAEGTPPPFVVWFKGDILLDNVTDGANTSTARLNIAQFQQDDEGYYSCIATNSIGSLNRSLQVSIVGECSAGMR